LIHTPELFKFKPRRDRATKLLAFLGDVTVERQSARERLQAEGNAGPPRACRRLITSKAPPKGTRQLLLELGPKKFAEWTLKQKQLLVTDTTFRDAHQSLFATRCALTTCWPWRMRWRGARRNLFSDGNVGRRDV
jgi:pyruvate carboxylase